VNNIQERKIIKKMIKQLSGCSRIEIFDILYKIEQLCNTVKNPDGRTIDAVLYSWENPRDISRVDGTFHYLVDYTYNLRIYRVSHPTTFLSMFRNTYFFKTPYCSKAVKFTKKNILKSFKHTSLEIPIIEFLKENRLKKKILKKSDF